MNEPTPRIAIRFSREHQDVMARDGGADPWEALDDGTQQGDAEATETMIEEGWLIVPPDAAQFYVLLSGAELDDLLHYLPHASGKGFGDSGPLWDRLKAAREARDGS